MEHVCAPQSTFRGDPLAALDRLPTALRRALHEAVICWDPREVAWDLKQLCRAGLSEAKAVAIVVARLRQADEDEVMAFAGRHWRQYGTATPHVRAKATILRYGARRRRQHREAWRIDRPPPIKMGNSLHSSHNRP